TMMRTRVGKPSSSASAFCISLDGSDDVKPTRRITSAAFVFHSLQSLVGRFPLHPACNLRLRPSKILERRRPPMSPANVPPAEPVRTTKHRPVTQRYRGPATRQFSFRLQSHQHACSSCVLKAVTSKESSTLKMDAGVGRLRKLCDRFFVNAQVRFGTAFR